MPRFALVVLIVCLAAAAVGCSSAASPSGQELQIAAAASLSDALQAIKEPYEREHPGVKLVFQFGSSGKLATQIEQGAPADLFLSASMKDMDRLQEKGLIVPNSRAVFAANELVLVTQQNSQLSFSSFEEIRAETIGHLAIGEPKAVPAGGYAKEVLEELGLWNGLQGKLVMGSDVRQVLTYVESGNADAGVVYRSDAAASEKVKILAAANPDWHQPIVYPGAVVTAARQAEAAQAFLDYLRSDAGQAVLQKFGFL